MNYKVEKIEGVGPKFAAKLDKVGIKSTKQLLERAATRKGRKDLATESGIDETLLLKWANMCDLMRIKGVGEEFSELLEIAGVDTVKELSKRRADNLRQAMVDANAEEKARSPTPRRQPGGELGKPGENHRADDEILKRGGGPARQAPGRKRSSENVGRKPI